MAARGLRVCNPVDHKQRHRIKYLYDDFRHKALTNENAPVDASIYGLTAFARGIS